MEAPPCTDAMEKPSRRLTAHLVPLQRIREPAKETFPTKRSVAPVGAKNSSHVVESRNVAVDVPASAGGQIHPSVHALVAGNVVALQPAVLVRIVVDPGPGRP